MSEATAGTQHDSSISRREHHEAVNKAKIEGAQLLLRTILQRRFRELPPWVRWRIEQASLQRLCHLAFYTADAASLEEAMGETAEHAQQALREQQNALAAEQEIELAIAASRGSYEEAYEQAYEEAYEEAFQQGRRQGIREELERLLIARFGELPEWVDAPLAAASADDLLAFVRRGVVAPTLEEALG